MKQYKGYLYYYAATGERSHFYCWIGNKEDEHNDWENHIMINESDIVKFKNKRKQYVILYFPQDMETMKKIMSKKNYDIFLKAAIEHWDCEVIKED